MKLHTGAKNDNIFFTQLPAIVAEQRLTGRMRKIACG